MKNLLQKLLLSTVALISLSSAVATAQFLGQQQQGAPAQGREAAPIDLTGTWVSIITEDWPTRMVTPTIGDTSSIPENQAAKEIAMAWRPEMDVGNECRAYGAPGIMNQPGRLKISWEDDMTLKMEIDEGMQTRLFHFDHTVPAGEPSRQGHSLARWVGPYETGPRQFGLGVNFANAQVSTLEIKTDNLIAGYLRKNGIPHSDQATVTEYIDVLEIVDGTTWLIDVVIVDDPIYLQQPYVVSRNFKKEPDDSKWNPQDCFVTNEGW